MKAIWDLVVKQVSAAREDRRVFQAGLTPEQDRAYRQWLSDQVSGGRALPLSNYLNMPAADARMK